MSRHKPETREEFRDWVMRQLGHGAIRINITDDQLEDCIEDSLNYYYDFHYDGSDHSYYIIKIEQEDLDRGHFVITNDIIAIIEAYTLRTNTFGINTAGQDLLSFNVQTGIDLYKQGMSAGNLINYYTSRLNYELMHQVIVGSTPIRFTRTRNRLHIDGGWKQLQVGQYIMLDCYTKVDPEMNPDVWDDSWLKRYTKARIKQVWGQNMSKYQNMQLPASISFDGQKMYDDATAEIQLLEDEMRQNYSRPPRDLVY